LDDRGFLIQKQEKVINDGMLCGPQMINMWWVVGNMVVIMMILVPY
jgi:hypothetical protein